MSSEKAPLNLSGAIIIAGALVAIAIIWTQKPATAPASTGASTDAPALPQVSMAPISAADHILGDPNAPIKLVEYADLSCPFCQAFNPTMEQIMNEYGPTGQVAWIYRQFPLDQPDANGNVLHPNAGRQAQAAECAAALGGNTAFWAYEKDWFETFPQDGADETAAVDDQQIAATAQSAGLNAVSFNDCLSSGRFASRVAAEYADGLNAGVTGTPYLIIITPTGDKIPLAGAQSYDSLKSAIDALLTEAPPTQASTTAPASSASAQ